MKYFFVFLFVAITSIIYLQNPPETETQLQKVQLDDPDTKCLDGSPYIFFVANGYGDGKDKFIIHFQGGGTLNGSNINETLHDAYLRAHTDVGSSLPYHNTLQFDVGILSRSKSSNPYFYNWNVAYLVYCDGSGHQGYAKDPIPFQDMNLYFRGENNTLMAFRKLEEQYNLQNMSLVILSGFSAGGYSVYNWAWQFRQLLNEKIRFLAVPDSGLFLDMKSFYEKNGYIYRTNYIEQFQQLDDIETSPPNHPCLSELETWQCLMAPYLLDYINVPMFIIQSGYDAAAIPKILQIYCVINDTLDHCTQQEIAYIEDHHNETLSTVISAIKKHSNWGAWIISCINHGYLEYDRIYSDKYKVNGIRLDEALWNWIQTGEGKVYLDNKLWPMNKECAYH